MERIFISGWADFSNNTIVFKNNFSYVISVGFPRKIIMRMRIPKKKKKKKKKKEKIVTSTFKYVYHQFLF